MYVFLKAFLTGRLKFVVDTGYYH